MLGRFKDRLQNELLKYQLLRKWELYSLLVYLDCWFKSCVSTLSLIKCLKDANKIYIKDKFYSDVQEKQMHPFDCKHLSNINVNCFYYLIIYLMLVEVPTFRLAQVLNELNEYFDWWRVKPKNAKLEQVVWKKQLPSWFIWVYFYMRSVFFHSEDKCRIVFINLASWFTAKTWKQQKCFVGGSVIGHDSWNSVKSAQHWYFDLLHILYIYIAII